MTDHDMTVLVLAYLVAVVGLLWRLASRRPRVVIARCWLCTARFTGRWALRLHERASHPEVES